MRKVKGTYLEIILHISYWLGRYFFVNYYPFYSFETTPLSTKDGSMLIAFPGYELSEALLFYGLVFWAFPSFFNKKKYLLFTLSTSVIYVISILIRTGNYYLFSHLLFPEHDTFPGGTFVVFNIFLTSNLYLIFPTVAYFFTKSWWKAEKMKQQLTEKKLKAELDFLKSQVNPHFLFNTLNNLFGLSRQEQAPQTANGIAKLSQMMRYMLHEAKVDFITIDKELKYIENFISLQKLRVSEKKDIEINLNIFENSNTNILIPPLLMIPLVENSFKHGISFQKKCFINISLKTDNKYLNFEIENAKTSSIHKNKTDEHSGIGLKNLKKRLELIYPEKHDIIISENSNIFKVQLKIEY